MACSDLLSLLHWRKARAWRLRCQMRGHILPRRLYFRHCWRLPLFPNCHLLMGLLPTITIESFIWTPMNFDCHFLEFGNLTLVP